MGSAYTEIVFRAAWLREKMFVTGVIAGKMQSSQGSVEEQRIWERCVHLQKEITGRQAQGIPPNFKEAMKVMHVLGGFVSSKEPLVCNVFITGFGMHDHLMSETSYVYHIHVKICLQIKVIFLKRGINNLARSHSQESVLKAYAPICGLLLACGADGVEAIRNIETHLPSRLQVSQLRFLDGMVGDDLHRGYLRWFLFGRMYAVILVTSPQTICLRMNTANVTLAGLRAEAASLKRTRNWKFILEHPDMSDDLIHPSRSVFLFKVFPHSMHGLN